MNKKFKYFISILLSLTMIVLTGTVVLAVEPRYSDTNFVDVQLRISGTTAYCTVSVTGAKGTTSITNGHLVLTDSKGNIKGDWSNLSSDSDTFFVSKTVTDLTTGETYTLSFSADVNRNGKKEPVSGSSPQP